MKKNSIREFVLRRLDEGAAPMMVHRETQDRFQHCGWLYVLKLKRERENQIDAEIARQRLAEIETNQST